MITPASDRTVGEAEATGSEDQGAGAWRYDSFLLRLWHASRGHRLRRIELHHLQTGLVETAVDRAPEWVPAAILRCLDVEDEPEETAE